MVTQVSSLSDQDLTILRLKGITKIFPGVVANEDLTLDINKGEILAILGENGAGKSTLMKILSGIYQPDQGIIELDLNWFDKRQETGLREVSIDNPRKAIQIGIGMVYQHFKLVERLSVCDNITLGKEITYKGTPVINQTLAEQQIMSMGKKYGIPIDPKAIVEDLPVGLKQKVEILKQLYRNSQLLILDEPTAVLSPDETEDLFKTMRELKASGKSIIFISHKLKEPLEIADRIVVMRNGKIIGETLPSEATEASLAEMLVGRKVLIQMNRKELAIGKTIMDISNLSVQDIRYSDENINEDLLIDALKNVNISIKEHQIVGIAGVQGNGQTELIESIMGLRKVHSGSIKFYPQSDSEKFIELVGKSTISILEQSIAYIPEDRSQQGIIHEFKINDNTWLGLQTQPEKASNYLGEESEDEGTFSYKKILIPRKLKNKFSEKVISDFDVAASSTYMKIKNLSGGNQQKVILGREFAKNPRLIIASQPTRGVDIGVTERVRNLLLEMREGGTGILLISSDLDEILALSDYIYILYEGNIVGEGAIKDLTLDKISQLMTGGSYKSSDLPSQI